MKCINCNADSETELCPQCTDSYKRLRSLVIQDIEAEYTDEALARQREHFEAFDKDKSNG